MNAGTSSLTTWEESPPSTSSAHEQVHPGERVLQACVQAAGRWRHSPARPAPGPSSSHGPGVLLWPWVRHHCPRSRWHPGARPPLLALSGQPSTARLPTRPRVCQAGWCSWSWAMCPCAASSSPGRPCAPPPWLQGRTAGTPTLPPCPAVVLKLQDYVNVVALAQQSCSSFPPLRNVSGPSEPPVPPAEAASLSERLRPWSWSHRWKAPSPEGRARCVCLNARHSTVFAFTQSWGAEAPNSE